MQQSLFDLIDEQNFVKVFQIIRENKHKFPNYKPFETEYTLNYGSYRETDRLAYKERLKTFIDACLQAPPAPQFLTDFSSTKGLPFVGRENELKTLHTLLQVNLAHVTVQSVGGIGKTTLVRKYVLDYQAHYAHIVWIEQNSSIIRAFVMNKDLMEDKDFKQESDITRFETIVRKLGKMQGDNLLVIDNYSAHPEDVQHKIWAYFRKAYFNHWRVLCTSREKIDKFKTLPLDTLSQENALKLFRTYATKRNVQDEEVKELLTLIDHHTLMTEMLAKSYQHSLRLERVAELTAILREQDLKNEALNNPIQIGESEGEGEKFYQYLNKVFNISTLSKNERYVLKQFAVLPPLLIAGKDFLTWITHKHTWLSRIWYGVGKFLGLGTSILFVWAQSKATYEKALLKVAQKGWLTRTDDNAFEMHRFVRMFLGHRFEPNEVDCYILYHHFMKLLDYDKVKANPLAHQWLLEYGEALLQGIRFKAKPVWKAHLQHNLASLYNALGEYAQAEPLYIQALLLEKELMGKKHQAYVKELNDLALLYETQGKYAEAERLYEEALQITKETIGTEHSHYATYLNNLAALYEKQGKYAEAERMFEEALQIDKETVGTKHPHYATRLNNLAELYKVQRKYAEAECLYEEALQIDKETVGTKHPNYAIDLNNLASLYYAQGRYAEAESLYKEALQITGETVGKKHPSYATRLHNLGSMYYEMGQYRQAKALLTEAYDICIETLGEEHPSTQKTKEWLAFVNAKL